MASARIALESSRLLGLLLDITYLRQRKPRIVQYATPCGNGMRVKDMR